jgi:DNA-binding NtrC family response regulator
MEEALPLLIVEGDQHMQEMLQRFLAHHKIETRAATSVVEAQALLAQHVFYVVLTELFRPHNDGLYLLRHIRATAPQTRVVLMAAMSQELQQCVIHDGAYAVLNKPFPLQRLRVVLQQTLPGDAPCLTH